MNPDPHADYRRQAQQHFGGPTGNPGSRTSRPPTVTGGYEHQNIALLPGEESLFAADFTPSPLLRHIKTGLVVTKDRVIVRYPQYMLFVIRVGHAESSVPIKHVCSMTTGRQLSQRRVMYASVAGLFGFFMLMSSLSMMGMSFLGPITMLIALALLAFAAFQAWLARGLALIVSHGGGGAIRVDVDKAEYPAMLDADSLVQQLVVENARAATLEAPVMPPAPTAQVAAPPPQRQPAAQPYKPPSPSHPATPPPAAPPSIWRG